MSANVKMGIVVAVHVAAGWLLSLAAQRTLGHFSLPLFALLALTFADAGLLGIWAGLSQTRLVWRVAVLAVGLPYLWTVCAIAFQVPCQGGVQFAMIAQPSVAIALVLHTLQASRRLRLEHLPLTPLAGHQWQFSIRQALLATAILALALGLWRVADFAILEDFGMVSINTIPLGVILTTLAAAWAMLGTASAIPRVAGVVAVACVVPTALLFGRVPIWYFSIYGTDSMNSALVLTIYGLQAVIASTSLLVLRSDGWRLIRAAPCETKEDAFAA